MENSQLKKIPGVDKILASPDIKKCINQYGRDLVIYCSRQVLDDIRSKILKSSKGFDVPSVKQIATDIISLINAVAHPSLKRVINATGVILHTNLGRAPLGKEVFNKMAKNSKYYTNIEFDLAKGQRGQRNAHITTMLRFITGAEHAIVVNNNAAAIVLVLNTLAKGKEVIISRSELIEIGGSFRIPDIMAASGVRMVEVGTTNRTRLSDYKKAISSKTGLIFKAHKSNFTMSGFIEEVSLHDLSKLAKKHSLNLVYDLGSGLIRKPAHLPLGNEIDVRTALQEGPDVVTFSCDKLLGGPQGGIIAGKKTLVQQCARAPLMRALRVCKLTLSALSTVCRHYFQDEELITHNPVFRMIEEPHASINERAGRLCDRLIGVLKNTGISAEVVDSKAQVGGGTLPDLFIDSRGVILTPPKMSSKKREQFAEHIFLSLMKGTNPVVAVLRKGYVIFDVRTVLDEEITHIAKALTHSIKVNPVL
jgi:L-seryl-tRNA(Ser) seleniumtransferase